MSSKDRRSRFAAWWKRAIEASGLDWFSPAARRAALDLPRQDSDYTKVVEGIPEEVLQVAVERSDRHFQNRLEQIERIESKAIMLLGTTGITTAFIVGFAGFLANWGAVASFGMICALSVVFALVVLALLMTVLLASLAVGVTTHQRLDDAHIANLSKEPPGGVSRRLVLDYLRAARHEQGIASRKGAYLIAAQMWFRNAIILVLVLTCMLAIFLPISRILTVKDVVASSARLPESIVNGHGSEYLPSQSVIPVQTSSLQVFPSA